MQIFSSEIGKNLFSRGVALDSNSAIHIKLILDESFSNLQRMFPHSPLQHLQQYYYSLENSTINVELLHLRQLKVTRERRLLQKQAH